MVCGVVGIGRDAIVDSLPSYLPLKNSSLATFP